MRFMPVFYHKLKQSYPVEVYIFIPVYVFTPVICSTGT